MFQFVEMVDCDPNGAMFVILVVLRIWFAALTTIVAFSCCVLSFVTVALTLTMVPVRAVVLGFVFARTFSSIHDSTGLRRMELDAKVR